MPELKIQIETNLFSAPMLSPSLTRISFMRWLQMNSKFEMFYGFSVAGIKVSLNVELYH